MDDFYMYRENMQREKIKCNITKIYEDTDGELSAVVGWPAIFAPGCHTSRNHPACKIKDKVLKGIHLYRRPHISKTTFFSVASTLKRLRHFGNNWTSLFLNRPVISSYDRMIVFCYVEVFLSFRLFITLFFFLLLYLLCAG